MSNQIPSQGSPYEEDPKNKYDEAFDDLVDQLQDMGIGIGAAAFPPANWEDVDEESVTYEELNDLYSQSPEDIADEVEEWNELLDIANEPDPGVEMANMLWEAERKKSQFPKGRGFSMKMSSTEDWLKKNKRVSE
jgi:hypothetical protein|tara:strand:+ start:104 stop:508 length:405 start_codon:yes stop_codon:yes gene_type:complete